MTTVISITGIITRVLLNNDLNILLTIEYKFILFRNYSNSLSLLFSRTFLLQYKNLKAWWYSQMTFKCRLEPQNYFNLISITLITIYKIINSVYYQITVKTYQ